MNMGLVTGLLVGGLLMLSIIALNVRVSQSAGQKTFQFMTKTKVHTVSEMISTDMRRVGAGIKGNNSAKIVGTPSSTRISFKTVDDNNQEVTITWQYAKDIPVTTSSNPNDFQLTRVSSDGSVLDYGTGIKDFKFRYFNLAGVELTGTINVLDIRRIQVELIVESEEKYGEDYNRSYWTELFTPRSIQRTGGV
jgi:hypothetical protein